MNSFQSDLDRVTIAVVGQRLAHVVLHPDHQRDALLGFWPRRDHQRHKHQHGQQEILHHTWVLIFPKDGRSSFHSFVIAPLGA